MRMMKNEGWMRCSVMGILVLALSSPLFAGEAEKKKAEEMVNSAIEFYKASGKDKAFVEISNPKSAKFHDGELYVFVYDMEGNVVAHGQKANMIGKNMLESKDPDGKKFVRERIEIAKEKGEGWQSYKFANPKDRKIEDKVSYLKKMDNYVFGAGVYK